jgi:hypothetical protein
MQKHKGMISIWFFIGILLLFYGVVITAQRLYELNAPPSNPVVRADLHIGIFWGGLLLIMGGAYTAAFRPKKEV